MKNEINNEESKNNKVNVGAALVVGGGIGGMQAALDLGFKVKFVRAIGNFQNVHGVPTDKVEQMRQRLEDLTIESVLASKKPF